MALSVFGVLGPPLSYLTLEQRQVCSEDTHKGYLVPRLQSWDELRPTASQPSTFLLGYYIAALRVWGATAAEFSCAIWEVRGRVRVCGQSPSPRATSFLQRGWEVGVVCPGQQGALETDREREEEQRSWPKEQPFEMISLCKFNCKDRWVFQQGCRANYEICFPKAIRTEKLHFKNSRWIENSCSMAVWSVVARLSIMLSKQVIQIFCSFFY